MNKIVSQTYQRQCLLFDGYWHSICWIADDEAIIGKQTQVFNTVFKVLTVWSKRTILVVKTKKDFELRIVYDF